MSFLALKSIHITCAAISFSLFFLRFIWNLTGSPVMRQRWVKIVPHVVDTMLLISALALAFTIGQYPFLDAWLTAKFFGLVLYIVLGSMALKYGRNKTNRFIAWLAAQAVFAYIVMVAIKHNPLPFT